MGGKRVNRNEKRLREKISSLEEMNRKLRKQFNSSKELLKLLNEKFKVKQGITKDGVQRVINIINDYCKKNDCSIRINNNGLIKEIVENRTFKHETGNKS